MLASVLDIERVFDLASRRTEQTFSLMRRLPGGPEDRSPIGGGRPPERSHLMAMIRVEPVPVRVRTDWVDGRPREITWGIERLAITSLALVRDETSAYPVAAGPRTVFEVDTSRARLALTFEHRTRRWTIDGLDEEPSAA
jgi:hypothetical protein